MKRISTFLLAITLIGCNVLKKAGGSSDLKLRFIDDFTVPFGYQFQSTTVGGLSGIDRGDNLYYLIADDRSDINPARFYTAHISVSDKGIDSVNFKSVHFLLQPNGDTFPNSKSNILLTPDPESIRYFSGNKIIWTSEGERIIRNNETVLRDPFVYISDTTGKFIDSFLIPSTYKIRPTENGPRRNGVFEGSTFSPDKSKLFVSLEEPLYEDGLRAGTKDSSAIIRIVQFNTKSKLAEKQFAYRIDPVAHEPNPSSAFKINGVPDILALNDHELLVVERSFSTGRIPCTIKLYVIDVRDAINIESNQKATSPVAKKLLLNMDDLGIFTDNIEGVCLGPMLPNGNQSLIFVSDDNFSRTQKTQLLLFELSR